jgi:formiminotetrahydrofolate cyclodeaminase
MKHVIDGLALVKVVAEKGNANSISDAGVSALMLHAAAESATLNVQINLNTITDQEFVGWHGDEVISLQRTCKVQVEEILQIVKEKIKQ